MKRIMPMLIILFMVISLVLPISTINNTKQEEKGVVEPTLLSDITYEMSIVGLESTPAPMPDPYEIAMENMQTEMAEIDSITDKKEWFISYKNIVLKYSEWIEPPKTIFDYFTEEEVRLIYKVVETECYDADFESKVNVANVVFNRYESGEFGETIEEIITSKNQFAYGRDVITEDTILSVMYAWEIEDTTNGCIAFRSGEKPEKWYTTENKYWVRQFIDDSGHGFYK